MKTLRKFVQKGFRALGYDVKRYDALRDPVRVFERFLNRFEINVIMDVGANAGQYAAGLRRGGFRGRIVSFEPISTAFRALQSVSEGDRDWEAVNCALGAEIGEMNINVAGNSYSSSFLEMLPRHSDAAPESTYIGTERIAIRTLDSVFAQYCKPADNVFLKIDVQGYTNQVLAGAQASLSKVLGLQLELSLVPLYKQEPLIGEVLVSVGELGFRPIMLKPEFEDRQTGQQLQVDGIFFRV